MEDQIPDLFPRFWAISGYTVGRYSSLKDDAPGGMVRATYLRLSITGADMPGGPPATEAIITFSELGSAFLTGRDVPIGSIFDSGAGYAFVEAVLLPHDFDIWWRILQQAQPATLFCLIQGEQVVELDIIGGAGTIHQPEMEDRRFPVKPRGRLTSP